MGVAEVPRRHSGQASGRSSPRKRRYRPHEPFLLIIVDHDNRRFVIEGPMINADAWTREVIAAQRSGRHVTCTVFVGSIDEAQSFGDRAGYGTLWPSGSIVMPP